jgi:hypothetical protein
MKKKLVASLATAAFVGVLALSPLSSSYAQDVQAPAAAAEQSPLDEAKAELAKDVKDAVAQLSTKEAEQLKQQLLKDVETLADLKKEYAKVKAEGGDVKAIEQKYVDTFHAIQEGNKKLIAGTPALRSIKASMTTLQIVAMVSGKQITEKEIGDIVEPLSKALDSLAPVDQAVKPIVQKAGAGIRSRVQSGDKRTPELIEEEIHKAVAAILAAE